MDFEQNIDPELESILKEAASIGDPFQEMREAEKAAAQPAPKPKQMPKKAPVKPDRGMPIEKRILADMQANAKQKASAKQAEEELQAINAQKAALGQTVEVAEQPAAKEKKQLKLPTLKKTVSSAGGAHEAVPEKAETSKTETEAAPKAEKKLPKLPKLPVKKEKTEQAEKAPKAKKERQPAVQRDLPKTMVALLVLVSMVCMLWVGVSVHPNTGSMSAVAKDKTLNMTQDLSVSMNNAAADALSNMTYIKKLFTIPESAAVAPKPAGEFGSTNDPAVVQAVVEQAADLLDGQELVWNPDIDFWDGEPIQYYYDETILSITWKEIINGNMVTFGEVKIAHGSQLRRALAGGEYGSSVEEYPTNMASNVNAVLAINGDFYGFRDLGISVYQRTMYRHKPDKVDTAYFTADGDMIFSKRGELTDKAEAEQFIRDNDVIFSVAFGPVMVENGEKVVTTQYPIGEIEKKYSRAAIGQVDKLHYLLMTINYEGPCQYTATLATAIDYIYDKGVQSAFALDGGQTASMVFNGELVNRVDWGNERTMSDIIYFASAVPEGGNS